MCDEAVFPTDIFGVIGDVDIFVLCKLKMCCRRLNGMDSAHADIKRSYWKSETAYVHYKSSRYNIEYISLRSNWHITMIQESEITKYVTIKNAFACVDLKHKILRNPHKDNQDRWTDDDKKIIFSINKTPSGMFYSYYIAGYSIFVNFDDNTHIGEHIIFTNKKQFQS